MFGFRRALHTDAKRYDLTKGYHRKRKYLSTSERDDYRAQGWDVTLTDEAPGAGVLVFDMEKRYRDGSSKGQNTYPWDRWGTHSSLSGQPKKSAGGRKTGSPYDPDRQIKIKVNQYDNDGQVVGRKFFTIRQGDFVQKESAGV